MKDGFIYVMLNLSMEGLVKVGRTNRDPKLREKELSKVTGVPTPFTLVYFEHFQDSVKAEKDVHSLFDVYRISNKREFFSAPVYEVIQVIQKLKKSEQLSLESNAQEHVQSKNYEVENNETDLASSTIEKGYDLLFGENGHLEDPKQAFSLFKKAEMLGSTKVYATLGDMHRHGLGCKKDNNIAINYYKKGAEAGFYECYAEMAIIFETEEDVMNLNNANKCWDFYFSAIINEAIDNPNYSYFVQYLISLRSQRGDIRDLSYRNLFVKHKEQIIKQFEIEMDRVPDLIVSNPYDLYYSIKNAKASFVQQIS